MTESKIQLTDRLRREGRWEEASKFRDQEKTRLRTDGKLSRSEANQRAWQAIAEKYPPLAPEQTDADDTPMPADLTAAASSSPTRFASDALWVYENLGAGDEVAKQAPSAGAWHLLQWARTNKPRFFEQTLPRAQQHFDKLQEEDKQQSEVIEEDLRTAEQMWAELECCDPCSQFSEKHSAEIRGVLESLAEGEPIGEAIRREAQRALTEITNREAQQRTSHTSPSTPIGASVSDNGTALHHAAPSNSAPESPNFAV